MNNDLKYFMYCRKSSEDSQRQIASIGDQLDALNKVVERENLTIIGEPFIEERSAKDQGRPIFNQMVKLLEKGKANALICWDIDRLSRNPRDSGLLQWMLLEGIIKVIKTPSRSYYQDDAGLLLSIESGRAMDYIYRLSKIVRHRLHARAEKGWRPISIQPLGYLNHGLIKGNKTVIVDPELFPIIRKMWDLLLTGAYSVSRIREIATNEWGLRTRKKKRIGGKPVGMSTMYRIFQDPFYYGYYQRKDPESNEVKMIKGKHKPMITEQEYWRAQVLLGRKGKPQPKTREFAYTGFMICGECESSITAEEKHQVKCSNCNHKFSYVHQTTCPKCSTDISEMNNPKIFNYVYYHCTKKKNPNCSQKTIRVEDLESQIDSMLESITINETCISIMNHYLKGVEDTAQKDEKVIRESLQSAIDDCQKRLSNLTRVFTSPLNTNYELFTEKEFLAEKQSIIKERESIEKKISELGENSEEINATLEKVFNFCVYARNHFNKGDLQTKRMIFGNIGSKHCLMDKKLLLNMHNPFFLIGNALKGKTFDFPPLEPENNIVIQEPITIYIPFILDLCSTREAVRTFLIEHMDTFSVPDLDSLSKEGDSS